MPITCNEKLEDLSLDDLFLMERALRGNLLNEAYEYRDIFKRLCAVRCEINRRIEPLKRGVAEALRPLAQPVRDDLKR